MKKTLEIDVLNFKNKILKLAAAEDVDSAVVVAAMADIMGMAAVALDRNIGLQHFDKRLDSFIERARQSYRINSELHPVLLSRIVG